MCQTKSIAEKAIEYAHVWFRFCINVLMKNMRRAVKLHLVSRWSKVFFLWRSVAFILATPRFDRPLHFEGIR